MQAKRQFLSLHKFAKEKLLLNYCFSLLQRYVFAKFVNELVKLFTKRTFQTFEGVWQMEFVLCVQMFLLAKI